MILVLGGTADTHEYIAKTGGDYIVTVATDYGYRYFRELYGDKAAFVRFTSESLTEFIKNKHISAVADTTHPFAAEISRIAADVCGRLNIPYINAKRASRLPDSDRYTGYDKLIYVSGWSEAAEALENGDFLPLFFTIGSKNLGLFRGLFAGAVVRVLDDSASVEICRLLGIPDTHVIAARGPFTLEENLETIVKYGIKCLVTKESGARGGLAEKLDAAVRAGIYILVIQAPEV